MALFEIARRSNGPDDICATHALKIYLDRPGQIIPLMGIFDKIAREDPNLAWCGYQMVKAFPENEPERIPVCVDGIVVICAFISGNLDASQLAAYSMVRKMYIRHNISIQRAASEPDPSQWYQVYERPKHTQNGIHLVRDP